MAVETRKRERIGSTNSVNATLSKRQKTPISGKTAAKKTPKAKAGKSKNGNKQAPVSSIQITPLTKTSSRRALTGAIEETSRHYIYRMNFLAK